MIGRLPSSVVVSGKEYILRTDYRNVLDAFTVFNDPDLTNAEKWFTVVYMMFEELPSYEALEEAIIDGFDLKEATMKLQWFFSAGKPEPQNDIKKPPSFDWEQDEQMIFSAVNHVAGFEVRNTDELHWWTFLSYFNEIGEGLFSYVVGIRKKKQKGKQLDKAEREFCRENPELVELKKRYSADEQAFIDEISELL